MEASSPLKTNYTDENGIWLSYNLYKNAFPVKTNSLR